MKIRKSFIVALLISIIIIFPQMASAQSFKDIPPEYAGYEAIEWAVNKKIIFGYTDKTFRKSDQLTEAQMAAVVSRYFNPFIETRPTGNHWSNRYYDYLKEVGILLPGHSDSKVKVLPVTRSVFAQTLATTQSPEIKDPRSAIEWLYENNITAGFGQSNDPFIDFRPSGVLERGQISVFFQRLDQKGFTRLVKGEDAAELPIIKSTDLMEILRQQWESDYSITTHPLSGGFVVRNGPFRFDFTSNEKGMISTLFDATDESFTMLANAYATSYKIPEKEEEIKKILKKAVETQAENFQIENKDFQLIITQTPYSTYYNFHHMY